MRTPFVVVLAIAWSLATGMPVSAQITPNGTLVTGVELQKMLDGGVLLDIKRGTGAYSIAMVAGNVAYLHYVRPGGLGTQDAGKWRITDDSLCFKWRSYEQGDEYCLQVYKTGDNAFEARTLNNGQLYYTYSLRR